MSEGTILHIKFEVYTEYDEYISKKDAAEISTYNTASEVWDPNTPWVKDDWDPFYICKAKVYVNDVLIGEIKEENTNSVEASHSIASTLLKEQLKLSEDTASHIFDHIFNWMEDDNWKNHILNGVIEFDLNLLTEEITNITGEGSNKLIGENKTITASFSIPMFEQFDEM